ncbi:hypothetical protein B0H16DRAFT_1824407 [Mycena metata]|uniref:Uncharacterized protein n=1 Tax=Mycena metata TaxID=1033252 RepID=A0AAD7M9L5_9AGAR|nr:hypothetical protein B0H16DRAFT_1824407 [Mycena metata]
MATSQITPNLPDATPTDLISKRCGGALDFQLHRLASCYGDQLHSNETHRKDVVSRERQEHHFINSTLAPEFLQVAQAIATLLTPTKGPTNFALMIGYTHGETHLFYCRNAGGPPEAARSHLNAIWRLLQQMRGSQARSAQIDSSFAPDRLPAEEKLVMELREIAYRFVAEKALERSKKRHNSLAALNAFVDASASVPQRRLVKLMLGVSMSATDVKLAVESPFKEEPWELFRDMTAVLYDEKAQTHPDVIASLHSAAGNLPDGLAFDFEKCLEKLLKVEAAILTLYGLAVSERRSEIVGKTLCLHEVEIPGRQATIIKLNNFPQFLSDDSNEYADIVNRMSDQLTPMADGIAFSSKVHSEVQLVAWVAQNLNQVAPEVNLVPYVTCSKLHCFACFLWLQEYNKLERPTLPRLAFNGCHGGLQRGWLPPSWETAYEGEIAQQMTSRLQTEFEAKHLSASTTSSGRVKIRATPSKATLSKVNRFLDSL